MANKKNEKIMADVITFTQADEQLLQTVNQTIIDCQNQAEGLVERIAGQLYIVAQKELYKIEDYKTVHEWAMATHDISKGTVSDAINTFARFGDGSTGNIKEKYSEYTFSSLIKMKKLTDEQITLAGITPTMSRAQITKAIEGLKVLEDKKKNLPTFENTWANCYKTLTELEPDTEKRLAWISSIEPEFFNKEISITVEMYENLIEAARDIIDAKHSIDDISKVWFGNIDTEERDELIHAYVPDFNPLEVESYEKLRYAIETNLEKKNGSTVEQEEEFTETEEIPFNEESEQTEQTESTDEQHTMPTVTINVNKFKNENGSINKKLIMNQLWELVMKVEMNEIDVVITKTE